MATGTEGGGLRVSEETRGWREAVGWVGGRGDDRLGDAGLGCRQFAAGMRSDECVFWGDILANRGSSPELDFGSGSRRKLGSLAALCLDEASAASCTFFSLFDEDR